MTMTNKNCEDVDENLLAYVDSQIPEQLSIMIDAHIQQCAACEAKVLEERKIQSILKVLPVKPMRANFKSRVIDSVTEREQPKNQYGFFAGVSVAIAASVMIWVVAAFLAPSLTTPPPNQPVVLTLNEVKQVKLAFEAPADFNEVTLTIELPEHVELDGFEGESRISWQTSLRSGKNVLALPLIVKDAIKGEIVATVSNAEKSKVFKVPLATLIHDAKSLDIDITTS